MRVSDSQDGVKIKFFSLRILTILADDSADRLAKNIIVTKIIILRMILWSLTNITKNINNNII